LRAEVEELSDLLRESIFEFIVSRVFIDYHLLVLVIGRMCAAIDFTSYIVLERPMVDVFGLQH